MSRCCIELIVFSEETEALARLSREMLSHPMPSKETETLARPSREMLKPSYALRRD
jgi:hypothetical protein